MESEIIESTTSKEEKGVQQDPGDDIRAEKEIIMQATRLK